MKRTDKFDVHILRGRVATVIKHVGPKNRPLLKQKAIIKDPDLLDNPKGYILLDNVINFKSTDERVIKILEQVAEEVQVFLAEIEKEKELQSA